MKTLRIAPLALTAVLALSGCSLIPTYERLRECIAHIQVADNPGRNEPGTGEIGWSFVLPAIERLGYDGYIGCEYRPKTTTTAGLGWLTPFVSGGARG